MSKNENSKIEIAFKKFYFRNEGGVIKSLPLIVGFLMFFSYFMEQKFFPAIDLFSLASLMFSAFIIGALFLMVFVASFWYPGWAWTDATVERKDYQKRMYIFSINESKSTTANPTLALIAKYFCAPLLVVIVIQAVLLKTISDFKAYLWLSAASILITSILSSIMLRRKFKLEKTLLLDQVFVKVLVLIFSWLVLFLVYVSLLQTKSFSLNMSVGISCALSFTLISTSALCTQFGYFAGSVIRIFLVFMVMIPTGAYSFVPGKIVNLLGLGNYQVQEIILSEDACKELSKSFSMIDGCSIKNPLVVWGAGDLWKIRVQLKDYYNNQKLKRDEPCLDSEKCIQTLLLSKDSIVTVVNSD